LKSGKRNGGLIWIVDPLDGSLNFMRGIPICCVSIGLWQKDLPILGVIYDFQRRELFTGLAGERAFLNGKPIRVSKIKKRADAVLCTGFPVKADFTKRNIVDTVEDIMAFKKVRLLGSAALSLAYVACARADFYREEDIRLWDVAAGLAIVNAAGGRCRFKKDKDLLSIAASNAYL
jgi:fructose-1,6-bisphosphatase/inositol monophosphatase family enzyme